MHFILSDAVDSGKSSFVCELVRDLVDRGFMVRGWTTPARMEGGKKVGHDFVGVAGGRIHEPIVFTSAEPFEGSFPWRRWHLSGLAFERSDEIEPSADLYVMDEIGPLELKEGAGFLTAARRAAKSAKSTLTVLRRGLEGSFVDAVGLTDFAIFSLASQAELSSRLKRSLARPTRKL